MIFSTSTGWSSYAANSLLFVMTYKICYVNFMIAEFDQKVYAPRIISAYSFR